MLISAEHVSKKYALKSILQDVSFSIEERDKIALVGINGTGKSTLLKILSGKEQCDDGTLLKKRDLRISVLEQDPILDDEATILQEVLQHGKDVAEYEAKSILTRLGMKDLSLTCKHLSGGQKKRVALAKALLQPCDLLLLDEPTNHLDVEMIAWLEQYLQKSTAAVFMVTHDRYFMERICQRMFELSQGSLYVYEANYSTYIEEKEKRLELARSKEQKRQQILKKELEWVRAGVQARTTKSRSRLERFEKMSEQKYEEVEEKIALSFANARLGKKTIECSNIAKSFGDHLLFAHFNYPFKRHDRIGIIGQNGCGKTTLLRILSGELQPDEGEVIYGETVRIGYFHQGHEEMDPQQRVIDYIREQRDAVDTGDGILNASQMLERFLFDRSMQYLPIKFLSGGEKRRLYLLKVLMEMPNVLLLDEPTNDLDITTLAILEDYLDTFPGIVVTVSHDRYFLDRICDALFIFQNGQIMHHIGGYSANQEYFVTQKTSPESKKEHVKTTAVPKMSSKEKQELNHMEETIDAIEKQMAAVDQQMGETSDFQSLDMLSKQREALQQELEAKMERWMELSERKAQIDALTKR